MADIDRQSDLSKFLERMTPTEVFDTSKRLLKVRKDQNKIPSLKVIAGQFASNYDNLAAEKGREHTSAVATGIGIAAVAGTIFMFYQASRVGYNLMEEITKDGTEQGYPSNDMAMSLPGNPTDLVIKVSPTPPTTQGSTFNPND